MFDISLPLPIGCLLLLLFQTLIATNVPIKI